MSAWKRDARPGSDGVTLYLEQDPQLGPFDQHWQRTARYDETVDFRPVDVITGLCIYSGTECLTSKILCKLLGQSLINLRWLRHEKSFDEVAFYDTNSFEPGMFPAIETDFHICLNLMLFCPFCLSHAMTGILLMTQCHRVCGACREILTKNITPYDPLP